MKIRTITLSIAAISITTLSLAACTSNPPPLPAPSVSALQPAAPVKVSTQEWVTVALSPGTVIIDVRTPAEFASGHVQGALNIPVEFADFQERITQLDPNTTFALYCRTGSRSAEAARLMNNFGYVHVYDLDGGFSDLENTGIPVS